MYSDVTGCRCNRFHRYENWSFNKPMAVWYCCTCNLKEQITVAFLFIENYLKNRNSHPRTVNTEGLIYLWGTVLMKQYHITLLVFVTGQWNMRYGDMSPIRWILVQIYDEAKYSCICRKDPVMRLWDIVIGVYEYLLCRPSHIFKELAWHRWL